MLPQDQQISNFNVFFYLYVYVCIGVCMCTMFLQEPKGVRIQCHIPSMLVPEPNLPPPHRRHRVLLITEPAPQISNF